MPDLLNTIIVALIVVVALFVVGMIFSRLYQRSSKERAFVRTGLGGQKVIMDGGAVKLPVFHELIWVNMNTLKLEVHRSDKDSLFTKDRMRVDVVAAFFVRVIPTVEGIADAAQTLGQRTLDPEALKALVEDKFVDALRAASVSMTMQDFLDKRQDFIQAVQNAVAEDLTKNGLELESVSLTSFDQTSKNFFNPDNAFDAEGLTRLTQETQKRSKERNEIEQTTQVAIAQKNFEATQQKLDIERNQRLATLTQQQEVATREAEQAAAIAAIQAQRKREAEQARIDAERQVKEADVAREFAVKQKQIDADRNVQIAEIDQARATQIANQEKAISVAKKSEEQSQAEAKANEARAGAVKAEQLVITAAAVAEAQREKEVDLVEADKQAQVQAIGIKVGAAAEKDAAENHAQALRIRAEANLRNYEVEAEGKSMINEAINKLSAEQIAMQVKIALITALPRIIAESVKPMEKIEGIKIFQVDGLTRSSGGGGGSASSGGGSLADQAVQAALSYRTQQPLIDALLKELGLKGGSLAGLTEGMIEPDPQPAAPKAPEKGEGKK
ncbi:flotillin family protein [Usitatibacter palustris]|uniref:Inner membrane protein YqiK n=1 Tax=Usitatibacter palustris TaxID=2732487 RepID=A0A6M4H601_9PROT|nr:flotillin family protein [Usitatibacter palustris]QJR14615.1 Inner membrane protein YqiK [Usitatibacter palustris]